LTLSTTTRNAPRIFPAHDVAASGMGVRGESVYNGIPLVLRTAPGSPVDLAAWLGLKKRSKSYDDRGVMVGGVV
jgi:hypothetical protein